MNETTPVTPQVDEDPIRAAMAQVMSAPLPPTPPDNVTQFPTRDGSMDRSGSTDTRQVRRSEERKEKKFREAALNKLKEVAPQIYNNPDLSEDDKVEAFNQLLKFNQPVTYGEMQQVIQSTLGMFEKLSAEMKKIFTSQQALLRTLVNNGVMTKDSFEEQARLQIEWNAFVNNIVRAFETVPLRELIPQIRQWNDDPAHPLKVEGYHLDLAKRLIDDEGMTLEEKLLTAQEMNLGETVLQVLRDNEFKMFNPPSLSAAAESATLPSDALADEPQQ